MITTFCLRLALGMLAPTMILPAAIVPPRFFRVQFLAALGLGAIAGMFAAPETSPAFWMIYAVAMLAAAAGSIVWHTEEAPLGRAMFYVGTLAMGAALILSRPDAWVDDLAGALVVGAAVSAMLMGHSYLIAPAMSLAPLNRLLALLAIVLVLRAVLACVGLYEWTRSSPGRTLDLETALWLGARWLLGLIIPIVLTWMAWETARIRSTQSATGILYVVTIVVFLGELLSMLLAEKTGFVL